MRETEKAFGVAKSTELQRKKYLVSSITSKGLRYQRRQIIAESFTWWRTSAIYKQDLRGTLQHLQQKKLRFCLFDGSTCCLTLMMMMMMM